MRYESDHERAHLLKRFRAEHRHWWEVDELPDEAIETLMAYHAFVLAHQLRSLWGELSAPLVKLVDWLEAKLRRDG